MTGLKQYLQILKIRKNKVIDDCRRMHKKITNTTIARMLDKRREFEESPPRYRIEKAIQDLHNLENTM
jgi:hypothetical protein